ncbi:9236_t:CDS:2 [Diversispora eburnea]|uniref:9236_t:CDS:1 n=1 Tax=Diversispora eburnea TaxID=1213867 RepID=A0A9N9B995_9GLOM|nr:9236_t:CDS:2 [Diversispora eburnea]
MNSPNEATHSLLRETLKVSTGKVHTYKRILFNKHGLFRFITKSILFFGGLAIFGILSIFTYETIKSPKYDSVLYDSNYVCHDSKTSFFSSLYSDNYLKGALLLGYTIKKNHPNHKMYLQYFPGRLSTNTICQLRSIGWIMKPVERIHPPWKGLYKGYRDQYTKLRMWSFTEFKDGIIYLDSDTIVLKYIANLFELIKPSTGYEFAASPDLIYALET